MYPIIPHFTEMAWSLYFLPLTEDSSKYAKSLSEATFPEESDTPIDVLTIRTYNCLQSFLRNVRLTYKKSKQPKKGVPDIVFKKAQVIYAPVYPEWQQNVLAILATQLEGTKVKPEWKATLKEKITGPLQSKSL